MPGGGDFASFFLPGGGEELCTVKLSPGQEF